MSIEVSLQDLQEGDRILEIRSSGEEPLPANYVVLQTESTHANGNRYIPVQPPNGRDVWNFWRDSDYRPHSTFVVDRRS